MTLKKKKFLPPIFLMVSSLRNLAEGDFTQLHVPLLTFFISFFFLLSLSSQRNAFGNANELRDTTRTTRE